jgi:hypothetical protein
MTPTGGPAKVTGGVMAVEVSMGLAMARLIVIAIL